MQRQARRAECGGGVFRLVTVEAVGEKPTKEKFGFTHQGVHVLHQEGVRIIQLIQRDIDLQILLRQRHVLVKLD